MGTWKITLADGTTLDELRLNGNNFISTREVTHATFAGKLSGVTITDPSGMQATHDHMALVQISQCNGEYWFVLRDLTAAELAFAQIAANVDYIAMFNNINLEEV